MKAVITGASGHLGANLMPALLEEGTSVRVVAHRNLDAFEGLDVEIVTGDVLDRASLDAAFAGCDVVYHLAAVISITGDPSGLVHRVNVEGAANAAEAALAAGVGRFVHCSSIHAFDLSSGADTVDEDGVIVHPTSVIGPRDLEPSRMGRFFIRLRDRSLPSLVRGGFDFVDARDVASGIIAAGVRGRTGQSYLLGGRHLPVEAVARVAERVAGVRPPRAVLPVWVARLGIPFIAAIARIRRVEPLYTSESLSALGLSSRIDHSLAVRELGYSVRPIDETIADIYSWLGAADD